MKRNDPQITKLLKESWIHLPPALRKISKNLNIIRFGLVMFIIIFFGRIAQIISDSPPSKFLGNLFDVNMIILVLFIITATVLTIKRAMNMAPVYIDIYAQMFPDHEGTIRTIYEERGLGDLFAPWIRNKDSFVSKLLNRMAKRFYIR
jgi:hypothetical protein